MENHSFILSWVFIDKNKILNNVDGFADFSSKNSKNVIN